MVRNVGEERDYALGLQKAVLNNRKSFVALHVLNIEGDGGGSGLRSHWTGFLWVGVLVSLGEGSSSHRRLGGRKAQTQAKTRTRGVGGIVQSRSAGDSVGLGEINKN